MTRNELKLDELFAQEKPGIVAITGGGGKTSLLFALARALAAAGHRVLCTTTTRMLRPAATEWLAVALANSLGEISPRPGALFAAAPPGPDQPPDKVYGYPAAAIDQLGKAHPDAWIVVEADGSAGRPLKAPAPHEPVIPARTALAVAVVGLSGVGHIFADETVFRAERFSAVTGLRPGDLVTPASLVPLIRHPEGLFKNVPAGARKFVFCNQADLPDAALAGAAFAQAALRSCPGFLDGFFVGALKTKGLACLAYPVI